MQRMKGKGERREKGNEVPCSPFGSKGVNKEEWAMGWVGDKNGMGKGKYGANEEGKGRGGDKWQWQHCEKQKEINLYKMRVLTISFKCKI
jgi:hypothetical protein